MENQRDNERENTEGYTPEAGKKDARKNESQEPAQNLKWDQAQRRHQAGPRSYNESIDSENISNQNTEADKEQISDIGEDPNDPKKIGDQISERQQRVDKNETPGNKDKNNG